MVYIELPRNFCVVSEGDSHPRRRWRLGVGVECPSRHDRPYRGHVGLIRRAQALGSKAQSVYGDSGRPVTIAAKRIFGEGKDLVGKAETGRVRRPTRC